MDKTKIKKFATEARRKLIQSVTDQAAEYGVYEDERLKPVSTGNGYEVYCNRMGREITLTSENNAIEKRKALAKAVEKEGFKKIVDTVAYTWFNRLIAIRFMEVHDYLPSKMRLLSSEKPEKVEPDMVSRPFDTSFDFTPDEKEKILELMSESKNVEVFRKMFLIQCHELHEYLPKLFSSSKQIDYKELLLDIDYADPEGVVYKLVHDIEENDFLEAVQIIGWLYQYYNDERKNEVINIYKGMVKKEDIPAATQLFTTDWVVRYMVDNSVGKYWIERNPQSKLKEKLEFYVGGKQEEIFIDEKVMPENVTCFDPCMGSAHILIYAFEVLMEIYRECGYVDKDAAVSIIENNLYGLEIDDRAYQIAYFALMMKARSYNKTFLKLDIEPNVRAIKETQGIDVRLTKGIGLSQKQESIVEYLYKEFENAKEIGSLQLLETYDYIELLNKIEELSAGNGQIDMFTTNVASEETSSVIDLIKQAIIMKNKYAAVVTNPPYLNKFEGALKDYVILNFKAYSGDLFSAFMYRNFDFCIEGGYSAFMTPFVWMYLKTYEEIRKYIITEKAIISLIQMEYSAFEEATVPICSFVLKNCHVANKGIYFKLSDFKGGMDVQKIKTLDAINSECDYIYYSNQMDFLRVDGMPIAYIANERIITSFEKGDRLGDIANPCQGLATTNNDRFLRQWYEVKLSNINFKCENEDDTIGSIKWFPFNKGGEFRKWYGNNTYVINFKDKGKELCDYIDETSKVNHTGRVINRHKYFQPNGTWSAITSGDLSVRYSPKGYIISNAGMAVYSNELLLYIIALLNSPVTTKVLIKVINESINFNAGDLVRIPVLIDNKLEKVQDLAKKAIEISKIEWDSYEISWDFKNHPLIQMAIESRDIVESRYCNYKLSNIYDNWEEKSNNYFENLRFIEEELNQEFADIYGLHEEMNIKVMDKDITIKKAAVSKDILSLISYAVGCMFGRYSLDKESIVYAGGEWDETKYSTFAPDKDNILPITENDFFSDDIVKRFVDFVEVTFGSETLNENLEFIADALGNNKGDNPKVVIRNYFVKDFYKDHLKTYQKRPIYWMFDSGKENGFKALVYLHRYNPDTIALLRINYLHKMQNAYENAISSMDAIIESEAPQGEKTKAMKQKEKYMKQLEETRVYDHAVAHIANQRIDLDLDDGVKVNYEKFQEIETSIDGHKNTKINLLAKI